MVLSQESFEVTVLIAVILAGVARTLIPYLSKINDDKATGTGARDFQLSYIITAVVSTVPVLVGSLLLLPTIIPMVPNTGSNLMIFLTAFGLAYTVNDVVNRSVSSNLIKVSTGGTEPTTSTTTTVK